MTPHDEYWSFEEEYHAKDRKSSRKERKRAVLEDRSKYKKTDQDQRKKREIEPLQEGLLRGRVLSILPEEILVDVSHKLYRCQLKGSLKKEKNQLKNLIAIGDFVRFSEDTGIISSIEERYSVLSRADNLLRRKEQLIAVNIDQVIITASVVSPPLKPFLIDRYIIAAQKGNMQPIIVVNKVDLLSVSEEEKELFLETKKTYEELKIPFLGVSIKTREGIDRLKDLMEGKASVFSGQSGVGKSSLINAILGTQLAVGSIVEKTFKGSHTTTRAHLIPLEKEGFCIDTPGIKSFGLWDLSKEEIQNYFPEIESYAHQCKYPSCSHQKEPGCAVQIAAKEGAISSLRYASYCALIEAMQQEHRHR